MRRHTLARKQFPAISPTKSLEPTGYESRQEVDRRYQEADQMFERLLQNNEKIREQYERMREEYEEMNIQMPPHLRISGMERRVLALMDKAEVLIAWQTETVRIIEQKGVDAFLHAVDQHQLRRARQLPPTKKLKQLLPPKE
jgi:hypothetical protein